MHNLFIKIVILAALAQFGLTLADIESCRSKHCLRKIEQRSRDVLRINWKPIQIFPEEARRFK